MYVSLSLFSRKFTILQTLCTNNIDDLSLSEIAFPISLRSLGLRKAYRIDLHRDAELGDIFSQTHIRIRIYPDISNFLASLVYSNFYNLLVFSLFNKTNGTLQKSVVIHTATVEMKKITTPIYARYLLRFRRMLESGSETYIRAYLRQLIRLETTILNASMYCAKKISKKLVDLINFWQTHFFVHVRKCLSPGIAVEETLKRTSRFHAIKHRDFRQSDTYHADPRVFFTIKMKLLRSNNRQAYV